MTEKTKILFCGDVEGRFNALFNRVESINKKSGPFSMLLCVGNFFGVNNKEFALYKSGQRKVTVPTYILGPNKQDHVELFSETEYELCPNVYYLGKKGLYTSSNGLKIAYLSGVFSSDEKEDYNYSAEDIISLRDTCLKGNINFRGVDILLTSEWPKDVTNRASNSLIPPQGAGNYLTAWLALNLKPRYHVSGLIGEYYERPPYRTQPVSGSDSDLEIVTRFLGLARVGNPKKDKWIYALNLTPLEKMKISELLQKTTDETECPYDVNLIDSVVFNKKRKSGGHQQYFYDMNAAEEEGKKKKQRREKPIFDQNKCWFCLASENVEKHLIVTVANSTYLALAKGALVEEHFLICPIEHVQSSLGQVGSLMDEVAMFKDALKKFYGRREEVPVFFERNYKTSHMQIQAVPIPNAAQRELKEIFIDEAEGHGLKLQELEPQNRLDQVIPQNCPYFSVELPNGTMLYTKISSSQNFPLNFAREVLCSGPILNIAEKSDWKDCLLSREEEESIVKRIRSDFEPFDFTEL